MSKARIVRLASSMRATVRRFPGTTTEEVEQQGLRGWPIYRPICIHPDGLTSQLRLPSESYTAILIAATVPPSLQRATKFCVNFSLINPRTLLLILPPPWLISYVLNELAPVPFLFTGRQWYYPMSNVQIL